MKKGITLMALAITIVVMIIILGTIVTGLSLSVTDTEMGAYAQDLRTIEEAITIKMAENEYDFLIERAITKNDILAQVDADKANQLTEEFELNGDKNSLEFYIVDVDKLNLKRNKYGKEKQLPNAIVISKETANIYYVKGKKFQGKTYFSTSSRLLRVAKIEEGKENLNQDVNITEKLRVSKLTRSYANKIEFKISTVMSGSENILIRIGTKEVDITNKITNGIYTLDLNSGYTAQELEGATNIEFIKKIGSKVLDTKEVGIANIDFTAPTDVSIKISETSNSTYLNLYAKDNKTSDVKEFMYVYENISGKKIPTNTTELKTYIQKNGRVTKSKSVIMPEGLSKVAVCAVDSAGNVSNPITQNLYRVGMPTVYPGLQPITIEYNREEKTSKYDLNWGKYGEIPRWANAKAPDGSYFVWIPRYAYRIVYYDTPVKNNQEPNPGRIVGYSDNRGLVDASGNPSTTFNRDNPLVDLYLLGKGENKYQYMKNGVFSYDVSKTDATNNPLRLMIHPAFSPIRRPGFTEKDGNFGWDSEVTGFWVSKFEMSEFNDTCKSIPGVKSENISASRAFDKAFNYSMKAFTQADSKNYTSMLMTNTQWGAVNLLATAAYGSKPAANTNTNYIGSSLNSLSTSTTEERSGVQDMSGLSYDLVSAYVANGNQSITQNAQSLLINKDSKYVDVYASGNTSQEVINNNMDKYGDGMAEINVKTGDTSAFANGVKNMPYGSNPVFTRGGNAANSSECGMYSVHGSNGASSVGTSYRVVLAMPDGNAN